MKSKRGDSRKLEYLLYILLAILVLWVGCIAVNAFAADQRTLILTWDQYQDPEGIGIRLYQSKISGEYNFDKKYAVADVSADVNEITICIDLDTYNFVAMAYRADDPNRVSGPSNELVVPDAFPPVAPNIKKKSLLGGCGL